MVDDAHHFVKYLEIEDELSSVGSSRYVTDKNGIEKKLHEEFWSIVINKHPLIKLLNQLPAKYFHAEELRGLGNIGIFVNGAKVGNATSCDASTLLAHSADSPFGKGSETVFDPQVRKGKELNGSKVSISGGVVESSIVPRVAKQLFPGRQIEAKFYKLAIYEPGGHFADHRDTTHADNHHGTLLIELRCKHEGGDLVLTGNDGAEHRWSLSSAPYSSDVVRYCAFYTDVVHRVEPVTSGYRIVLQYDLLVIDEEKPKTARKMESSDEDSAHDGSEMMDEDEDEDEEQSEYYDEEEVEEEEDYDGEEVEEDESDDELKDGLYGLFDGKVDETKAYLPSPVILSDIIDQLATCVTTKTNIAIPLYHLYRQRALTAGVHKETTLLVTGSSPAYCMFHQQYLEYTGNEAELGEGKYFAAAMVVSLKDA